jgi:hypothetical protein
VFSNPAAGGGGPPVDVLSESRGVKKFLLGVVAAFGLMRLLPEVLKRRMAPSQRPQPHTPADLGLPEVPITLQSVNGDDPRILV